MQMAGLHLVVLLCATHQGCARGSTEVPEFRAEGLMIDGVGCTSRRAGRRVPAAPTVVRWTF